MSNNKQSSIDWLAEQLKKDINLRLRGFDIDKAFEQAKAMHKEEHRETWDECLLGSNPEKTFEDHYNETYESNS